MCRWQNVEGITIFDIQNRILIVADKAYICSYIFSCVRIVSIDYRVVGSTRLYPRHANERFLSFLIIFIVLLIYLLFCVLKPFSLPCVHFNDFDWDSGRIQIRPNVVGDANAMLCIHRKSCHRYSEWTRMKTSLMLCKWIMEGILLSKQIDSLFSLALLFYHYVIYW